MSLSVSTNVSQQNSKLVGFPLLDERMKIPGNGVLRFPGHDEHYIYEEDDFSQIGDLNQSGSMNTVYAVIHIPSQVLLAKKRVKIKWSSKTIEGDEEENQFFKTIREIDIHLKVSGAIGLKAINIC